MTPLDAALDIETLGLDPWTDKVVTIAVVSNLGDDIHSFDTDGGDDRLALEWLDDLLRRSNFERVITWNGSEFDLPFLGVRMLLSGAGLFGGPHMSPTETAGKYGKPRYRGSWWSTGFYDVAYDYESYCEREEVKWSLKPLAEHLKLGGFANPPDFAGGASIMSLTRDERLLYCSSDASQALMVWDKKDEVIHEPNKGLSRVIAYCLTHEIMFYVERHQPLAGPTCVVVGADHEHPEKRFTWDKKTESFVPESDETIPLDTVAKELGLE